MRTLKEKYNKLLIEAGNPQGAHWGHTPPMATANLSTAIVNLILIEAVLSRTSDIHIEPYQNKLRIRFRIDGKLYDVLQVEQNPNITIIPRIKVLANMPIDAISNRTPMDGRFTFSLGSQKVDFRLATFPTLVGEKVAIRILNKNFGTLSLNKIGLDAQDCASIEMIIQRRSGLLVVSGPTGSGKTSTLYSILHRLSTPHVHIVTLEDPVEYQIDGINQCDINTKGDGTFAQGLKAILRQDPDVILVGEIRDKETAEIAIRAAITGHLVLTSLHANSALGTAIRLINMGLEKYMVSYAVSGSVAQRLVPRICDTCKKPYTPDQKTLDRLTLQCNLPPHIFNLEKNEEKTAELSGEKNQKPTELCFYKTVGCDQCNGTGYQNRVGIFEVAFFTDELRDAIVSNTPIKQLEAIASKIGYKTLAIDAIDKLKRGLVTLEDVYPILLERAG